MTCRNLEQNCYIPYDDVIHQHAMNLILMISYNGGIVSYIVYCDYFLQERIDSSQLSKSITEQKGEPVKPPDKPTKNDDIRCTEVTALNMEVDTLRWQLAQVL